MEIVSDSCRVGPAMARDCEARDRGTSDPLLAARWRIMSEAIRHDS